MKEQEAIERLKVHFEVHNDRRPTPYLDEAVSMAIAALENRKHGNWILLDECSNTGVYCSVCHKKVYKADYANQKVKSKFCPNCGAIMDGEFERY